MMEQMRGARDEFMVSMRRDTINKTLKKKRLQNLKTLGVVEETDSSEPRDYQYNNFMREELESYNKQIKQAIHN